MSLEQENNPLHGVKLEIVLTELVDHYGWEILAAALNLNCFKNNPSVKASLKFLRKTQWAQEKLEGFYLYKFKRLPKPDDTQYELAPRDRIIPSEDKPRSPAVLTLESIAEDNKRKQERQSLRQESKARSNKQERESPRPKRNANREQVTSKYNSDSASESQPQATESDDIWAKWKK